MLTVFMSVDNVIVSAFCVSNWARAGINGKQEHIGYNIVQSASHGVGVN